MRIVKRPSGPLRVSLPPRIIRGPIIIMSSPPRTSSDVTTAAARELADLQRLVRVLSRSRGDLREREVVGRVGGDEAECARRGGEAEVALRVAEHDLRVALLAHAADADGGVGDGGLGLRIA